MTSTPNQPEEKFAEAAKEWNLEKLYQDLEFEKKNRLTPKQKEYLRGVLCYYTPHGIADLLGVERSTVTVNISNGLSRYLKTLLNLPEKNINWNRIPKLLEKAGYKKQQNIVEASLTLKEYNASKVRYSQEFIDLLDAGNGKISLINRRALDALRVRLELPSEKTIAIENEHFQPYRQYEENLHQYKETLAEAILREYCILSDSTRITGLLSSPLHPVTD